MKVPSHRERAVLAAITAFQEAEGRSPSHREIARACGLKHQHSAVRVVTRLRERKLLCRSYSVCGAKGSDAGGLKISAHKISQTQASQ